MEASPASDIRLFSAGRIENYSPDCSQCPYFGGRWRIAGAIGCEVQPGGNYAASCDH